MNYIFSSIVGAAALVAFSAHAADAPELKADAEKDGYSVGYDIGRSVKRQLVDLDVDAMARGLKDAMTGKASPMTDQEMQQRYVALRQQSIQKVSEKNKKDGEEFLAKNKKEKGVKTTDSGLQYKVITAGKGKKPTADDTVTVNYRGTLVDGTEFDSSYKRGQPATFPVKGVIAGWTEALQLMPEGSKWMIYLPSKIAYGERGAGSLIGPHSALVFEVELVSINKPEKK
jgi:FKBP-type peptidyl-prolyl cis-trans isomerase FklB